MLRMRWRMRWRKKRNETCSSPDPFEWVLLLGHASKSAVTSRRKPPSAETSKDAIRTVRQMAGSNCSTSAHQLP